MKDRVAIGDEFVSVFKRLEVESSHFFITGRAGPGKSTLLEYFRDHTHKQICVVAPTGVSALNIHGQTIHSFFGFRPDTTVEKIKRLPKTKRILYERLETVVIDEISMVRADTLDCIDIFLRKNRDNDEPFGGVQLVLFGDLFQLPPVVAREESEYFREHYTSPYFFDAFAMQKIILNCIKLETVYRQTDEKFIELLDAIRCDTVTASDVMLINNLVNPDFYPRNDDFFVTLTTTNALADKYNETQLGEIIDEEQEYRAEISGKFEERAYPAKEALTLKKGAQVMMLNNDIRKRWVNGSMGKIVDIRESEDEDDNDIVSVRLTTGETVDVEPYRWEMLAFSYDADKKVIISDPIGFFDQYPMMLAWAVTIHKSQGKTFDRVIIDFGDGAFAHGQAYVALSRCTTMEGVILRKPMRLGKDIITDKRILHFSLQNNLLIQKKEPEMNSKRSDIQSRILDAIKRRGELRILFRDQNGDNVRYHILPSCITAKTILGDTTEKNTENLIAFDFHTQTERTFPIYRILRVE